MTTITETQRHRRGHRFYPTKAELKHLPALGATDGTVEDARDLTVGAHYFTASGDWYVCEYDPSTTEAFGYVDLGYGGEFGYFMLNELETVRVGWIIAERDMGWTPVTVRQALADRGR